MPNLIPQFNKTLKLVNVLSVSIPFNQTENIALIAEKQINFIRNKGFIPVGPSIQSVSLITDEKGTKDISLRLYQQVNGKMMDVEKPYEFSEIYRVPNCLYLHFEGQPEKLQIAYDKLNVVAYEENIELEGSSYTIYISDDGEKVIADIFMPQKNH